VVNGQNPRTLLHRIGITQSGRDEPGRAYFERRIGWGSTKTLAIRAFRRRRRLAPAAHASPPA
jgi:hypothetical protein